MPFFMLAEELMNAGRVSRRIVAFAISLIGHVNGGLGCVAMMRQAADPLPNSAGLIAA